MGLDHEKYVFLQNRYKLKFEKGQNKFSIPCEFCNKTLEGSLRVSKKGFPYEISCPKAQFHHDENRTLHFLCYECHKRIYEWGVIQRWLKKIGKTIDEIPDASKLQAIMRGGF